MFFLEQDEIVVEFLIDSQKLATFHFSGPITSTRTALIRDLFSYGFARKLRAGPYGSCDNIAYLVLLSHFTTENARAELGRLFNFTPARMQRKGKLPT